MLWVLYGVVGFFAAILLYPILRLYSINRVMAAFIALLGVMAAVFLTHHTIAPHFLAWQYERNIRMNNPIVSYLAIKSPDELNEYLSLVRKHVRHTGDLNVNNEVYFESEYVNKMLVKYGPYASSDTLYQFLKTSVEFDKKLIQVDPALVLYHEFPDKFTDTNVDFSKLNRQEYLQTIFSAAENVIKSGIEHPGALPTNDESKKAMLIFRDVVESISKKYGAKVVLSTLGKPHDPALDKKLAATIVIAFYEAVLAKGQEDAALFMRVTMMLNQSQSQPQN